MANYFIDNPNNYKIVEHVDKDKSNNNSNNLRWVKFIASVNIKVYDRICQIDTKSNKTVQIWNSYKNICKHYNVSGREINKACINNKILKGYLWKVYKGNNIEVFGNVSDGTTTDYPTSRSYYIANPSGAYTDFNVSVYALYR